ncbi:MAG TPA: hydroxymethylglutaryl-CoA lyase, partial [Legionella sp.]|nr:hydroxymethylglutaryl-CoA lyase [Legionella sp.]
MNYPSHVTMIEVGPRDGLQNEASFVPTKSKIELINALAQSGLQHIEVTSFVSSKSVPQLADGESVFQAIDKPTNVHFSALVPNERGMQKALAAGVKEIAIFTAASEQFNQRNINCSITESIARFSPVMAMAKAHSIRVRGYISCALGCPYEGDIDPKQVLKVAHQLLTLGATEISLGDTIGVGTPKQTQTLINTLKSTLPLSNIAMHFHDTYGQAIANIYASLACGINRFDSSVAGLGGCPYAQG